MDWMTEGRPRWKAASERYARGAKGEVHVFQRESGVRIKTATDPGSIWQDAEHPALMRPGSGVNEIVYHLVRDDGTSYIVR
jgi:hypothetical protein